jgi:hypothetical protein
MTASSDEDWELEEEDRPETLPGEFRTRRSSLGSRPSSAEAVEGFRPLASLAFWCCLGLSIAILAAVFLAPRLRTYRDLKRQYDGLERELIAAEGRVDYLQKVVDALQHDSQFAAELARADFGAISPAMGKEERIAVPPALNLKSEPMSGGATTAEAGRPFSQSVLDTPLLDTFSDDRSVRSSLLGAASVLVLVAFTLLCDKRSRAEDETEEVVEERSAFRQWLDRRYTVRRS